MIRSITYEYRESVETRFPEAVVTSSFSDTQPDSIHFPSPTLCRKISYNQTEISSLFTNSQKKIFKPVVSISLPRHLTEVHCEKKLEKNAILGIEEKSFYANILQLLLVPSYVPFYSSCLETFIYR